MKPTEKQLERKLVKAIKQAGGACLKYYNPALAGFPDRLCITSTGHVFWVELKGPGGKPRPLQQQRIKELRRLSTPVYIVNDIPTLNWVINYFHEHNRALPHTPWSTPAEDEQPDTDLPF